MTVAIAMAVIGAALTLVGTMLQFADWRQSSDPDDIVKLVSQHIDRLEVSAAKGIGTGNPTHDALTSAMPVPGLEDITFEELEEILQDAPKEAALESKDIRADLIDLESERARKRRPRVMLSWLLILAGATLQLVAVFCTAPLNG